MPRAEILQHGRDLLQAARNDRGFWDHLEVQLTHDESDVAWDDHELDRLEIAWALQYDARTDDAQFIRFILEKEIEWRRQAPYQGIGEALEILAWFVARERKVDDVWLMARAKQANFDTACGFNGKHLFASGVEHTISYVKKSEHPDRDSVMSELLDENGRPRFLEEDVQNWLKLKNERFSTNPDDSDVECWLERSIILGNHDITRKLIQEWWEKRGKVEKDFSQLTYYLVDIEDFQAAAEACSVVVEQLTDPFELTAELCRLASLARRAGNTAQALSALERAASIHRSNANWRELGMGRNLVLECFKLAESCNGEISRRSFDLAEEFPLKTHQRTLEILEAAMRASQKVDARERVEHYRQSLEQKRAQVERELKKMNLK